MNLWFEEITPAAGREKEKTRHLDRLEAILSEVELDGVAIPEIVPECDSTGAVILDREREETLAYAVALHALFGINAVPYRVVVVRSVDDNVEWLKKAHASGVSSVVLVGARNGVDYKCRVEDVNTHARELGLNVGNIVIPSRAGEDARVKSKRDSGASFFVSQMLFEADRTAALLEKSPMELYACFSPLSRPDHLEFVKRLGCDVPADAERRFSGQGHMAGSSVTLAAGIYQKLAAHSVHVLVSDLGRKSNYDPAIMLLKHFRKFD